VIGYKRLVRFADATISGIRVRFTQFRVRPTLAGMGLYFAPAIISAPKIARDANGVVTIRVPQGTCVRYTMDGSSPTANSQVYEGPIQMPRGGVIIGQTSPLTPGRDVAGVGAAVTRMEFGLAKAKWRIFDCDSQNSDDEGAAKAIDDNPRTIWHTRYRDGVVDPMPHHVSVDLGETVAIRGFTYTPRPDQWEGGIIMRARFEVSKDGKNWTIAADDVVFDNIVNSRQQQVVRLTTPMAARYFRLTALRTANDSNFASAADVSVLVK
jgi:alpha-L-fucosidase